MVEPISAASAAGIAGLQLIQTCVSNLPMDFAGLVFHVDNETDDNIKLEAYDNIYGNVKESPTDIKAKSKMMIAISAKRLSEPSEGIKTTLIYSFKEKLLIIGLYIPGRIGSIANSDTKKYNRLVLISADKEFNKIKADKDFRKFIYDDRTSLDFPGCEKIVSSSENNLVEKVGV